MLCVAPRLCRWLAGHAAAVALAIASPAVLAASITGASSTSTSNVNITSYATQDWVHWGDSGIGAAGKTTKNPKGTIVGDYSVVGGATETTTTSAPRTFSWSSGTPTVTSSSDRSAVTVSGVGNGFRLVVPADAQARTVRFYVAGSNVGATFSATLSDGSATPYTSTVSFTSGTFARQYTVSYTANGPGRTLALQFTITSGAGTVMLQAAGAPTFTYVNHQPTISAPASATLQTGQTSIVQVTGADIDGDTLTYSASGLPPGLSINSSTGAITGSPTAGGTYVASVSVRDPASSTASGSISFTVSTVQTNTAPTAASATFSTAFETPIVFTPTWVDPDVGDSWTVVILTPPAHGTASVSGTQITYTPDSGYVGSENFSFRVIDSYAAFVDGTANGSVTSVMPAQAAGLAVTQGTVVGAVNLTWSTSANATSYDVYRGVSASDPSPTMLGNTGNINFSDSTASPGVIYHYSVTARNGAAAASPSATVSGFADTVPTAASGTFAATLETPVTFTPTVNEPDPGDTGTLVIVSQPANGTAQVVASNLRYTPNTGFVGSDSFTFSFTDRAGASVVGTASGTVVALPPAQVTGVVATQGTVLGAVDVSWPSSANARSYRVLRGTSPGDPSPATLATVTSLSHSDATASPGVTYYYSVQALTVGDQAAASPTVPGFADTAPSGATATFSATLETPTTFTPTFVDPDAGDTATLAIVAQPTNGSAQVVGSQLRYTPNVGYVGADSFSFKVTDRAGASVNGTASGTVTALTPAPVVGLAATQGTLLGSVDLSWPVAANARSYRVLRAVSASDPSPSTLATVTSPSFSDGSATPGTPYYYSVVSLTVGQEALASSSVLGYADTPPSSAAGSFSTPVDTSASFTPSFNDPDAGDTFTFTIVSQPSNGLANVAGNSITYQPNPGFIGADNFTFRVTDRAGASVVGTASGTVFSVTPDPVPGLTASQATQVNSVNVAWSASLNSTSYIVYRSTNQTDPSPTQLDRIAGLSYTDPTAAPGVRYYYFVRGANSYQNGALSAGVQGFADTPPSNLAATFNTYQGQQIMIVPTWDDPDPGESFTVSVLTQPSGGTAQVVTNQIRYTPNLPFVGNDSFTFSVTDRAGITSTATATGVVAPGIPDAPRDFTVTQGTQLGAIKLNWTRSLGTVNHLVLRSEVSNSGNPDTIATVASESFDDSNVTPGSTYYYRIRAVGVSGTSPSSQEVSGYADTPPSAASATATTIFNVPVQFGATVTDGDPLDFHLLTILTPPSNGTVSLNSERTQFLYTPNAGWSGLDAFTFRATDVANASVDGNASVSVGCPTPSLSAISLSQPKLFAGSGFKAAATYGNTACPTSITATFEVKSGTTVVYSNQRTGLNGVVSSPVEFAVDGLQAGVYSLVLNVRDLTTGNSKTSTLPLAVSNYRMPSFTATSTLFQNLDNATIAVGASQDCTLTSDRAMAIADHNLCYYEVLPLPPGLTFQSASVLPTWSGKVTASGTYTPTFAVYQFDDFGTAKVLGSQQRTMNVQPVSSMTFTSPPTVNVAQFMQEATVNVQQTGGNPCVLTTSRSAALLANAQGNRSCLLEFAQVNPYQTVLATGLKAPFLSPGTTTVNWSVSTFDSSGNQLPFATGGTDVNVLPPDIAYVASAGSVSPIATVTQASIRLNQTGSLACTLTMDQAAARVAGVDKPCLVQWKAIPEGFLQDTGTNAPVLQGVFKQAGQQNVQFDISYQDVSGATQLLWSGSSSIYVNPPPMPEIILKAGRNVGPTGTEVYAVPVTGGNVATLLVDVSKWPVDVAVQWSDETMPRTYRVSPARNSQIIDASPAPMWTRRSATIKLYLRDAPTLFVEKTVEVVSVPVTGVMLDLDGLNATVADNVPVPLTAHVSVRSTVGPVYDANTIGQWNVQFGYKDAVGNFVPSGAPVLTNSNGQASATVSPFGQTVIRAIAQAVPQSPYSDIQPQLAALTSQLRSSTVVKGTPIEGTVQIKGLSEGPAPLVGIFRVAYDTRSDQVANLSVNWHLSSDNGSTWTKLDLSGVQIVQRLAEGRYQVKASFINRNNGVQSETDPVSVAVWAVPKVSFTGPRYAFPGSPMTIGVKLTHPNGTPVQSGTVNWAVVRRTVTSNGEPPVPLATGSGESVQFSSTEPGIYMLTAKARMNSSNPDNPASWGIGQYQITYGVPEKPFSNLVAPSRAEVGKSYKFEVTSRTRFDITATALRIVGQWTLPDGTVVPGLDPVNYTPTDDDLSKGNYITMKHEAWIEGYQNETSASFTKSVPIWKYVWPTWKTVQSVTTTVAPTASRVTVLPGDLGLLPTLEGLTYTWTLPATMRALSAPGSKLDAAIDYGGSHVVRVVVSDSRGNSTPMEVSFTVGDPKAYVIDLPVANQSKWSHAPLQVGLSPKVSGGHPSDSIIQWKYYIDGNPIDLPNRSLVSVALEQPGTYNLEVRVNSKMGATASKSVVVNVPPNVPPTCTVSGVPSANRLFVFVTANCKDTDGSITKYEWSVNGTPLSFSPTAKWTYTVQQGVTYPISFDVRVTDDGGAVVNATATAN